MYATSSEDTTPSRPASHVLKKINAQGANMTADEIIYMIATLMTLKLCEIYNLPPKKSTPLCCSRTMALTLVAVDLRNWLGSA